MLIEQQLQGCEVDVELVLQEGVTYFAAVADNPEVVLPFQVESATTYPSQLSASLQAQCIAHAEAALRTLSYTDGNFHVEMVCTSAGPKIIEVNPRMGGAFVWHAISAAYHVDLVRMGILAGLHRLMATPYTEPNGVFEARFFIAEKSGTLAQVEGIDRCAALPGVHDVSLWKQAGDAVACPRDDTADYLGFVLVDGKNYLQACERADEALAAVTFAIN